jgi:glycosyltransferase involved in cell wall biosynthesis
MMISKGILKNNEKTVLINGSGVDLDVFRQAPILPSISFLLIARLIKEKGIYEFVESARTVRKKYPNVKFKLVGFLDKNPRSISEYDLQSWIESGEIDYKGYMKDVRPAIEESSVYVLPSYYREGIPRSILEAMAMGRPIITSDAPGCRETVQEGRNGFLVPVKNVSALVDAITYFVEHPEEVVRMGGESRQIAIEKYDVHKVNAKILNIMELV